MVSTQLKRCEHLNKCQALCPVTPFIQSKKSYITLIVEYIFSVR